MATRIAFLFLLPVLLLSVGYSQYSEVSRISEEGVLETLGLELKFNCPVINPGQAVQCATLDDIALEYEHVRAFLEDLAGNYREVQLIKQSPSAFLGGHAKTSRY